VSNYVQQGSFTLPQPNQETVTVLFDVLGDGRLITSDGSAIHIENLGSRQFTQVGAVPPVSQVSCAFHASALR